MCWRIRLNVWSTYVVYGQSAKVLCSSKLRQCRPASIQVAQQQEFHQPTALGLNKLCLQLSHKIQYKKVIKVVLAAFSYWQLQVINQWTQVVIRTTFHSVLLWRGHLDVLDTDIRMSWTHTLRQCGHGYIVNYGYSNFVQCGHGNFVGIWAFKFGFVRSVKYIFIGFFIADII